MNFEKFAHIGLDIIGPLHESFEGYKYLIVITDNCSKWVVAFPTKNNLASTVGNLIADEIITIYGWPTTITTNQNDAFCSWIYNFFDGSIEIVCSNKNAINLFFCDLVLNLRIHWLENWRLLLLKYKDTINHETGEKPIFTFLGKSTVIPKRNCNSYREDCKKNKSNINNGLYTSVQIDVDRKEDSDNVNEIPCTLNNELSKPHSATNSDEKSSDVSESTNKEADEYDCLNGNQWLSDIVVNNYGTVLTENSRFKFVNSWVFQIIINYQNNDDLKAYIEKLKEKSEMDFMDESAEILGIANVNNNHWIGFHIIPKKSLSYYDPLGKERDILFIKFLKKIDIHNNLEIEVECVKEKDIKTKKHMKLSEESGSERKGLLKKYKMTIKKEIFVDQNDTFNCGVYTCGYIDFKVNKCSKSKFVPKKYRLVMRKKLLKPPKRRKNQTG